MTRIAKIHHRLRDPAGAALKVFSVDLFDTLLLRDLDPEPKRFHDIAERWAQLADCREHCLKVNAIFEARWQCAKVAYRAAEPRYGVREATLSDILRLQLLALGLPERLLREVFELELAYEASVLSPNPAVIALCRAAREIGCRVVIVSDMYLQTEDITRLLDHHGLAELADAIYVSAAFGFSKRSGHLFRHLLREEAVTPAEVLHIGDHPHSDHTAPRALGIEAYWLPRPLPWRSLAYLRDIVFRWNYSHLRLL